MITNVNVGIAENTNIAGRDIHIHHNSTNQSPSSEDFQELGKNSFWFGAVTMSISKLICISKVDPSESAKYETKLEQHLM